MSTYISRKSISSYSCYYICFVFVHLKQRNWYNKGKNLKILETFFFTLVLILDWRCSWQQYRRCNRCSKRTDCDYFRMRYYSCKYLDENRCGWGDDNGLYSFNVGFCLSDIAFASRSYVGFALLPTSFDSDAFFDQSNTNSICNAPEDAFAWDAAYFWHSREISSNCAFWIRLPCY